MTIISDQILNSSCEGFLTNVKQAKSNWIKNPNKFDCARSMIDITNMYTNYTSTGHWNKADSNEATIITLVTVLKKEHDKNSPKVFKTPGAP